MPPISPRPYARWQLSEVDRPHWLPVGPRMFQIDHRRTKRAESLLAEGQAGVESTVVVCEAVTT